MVRPMSSRPLPDKAFALRLQLAPNGCDGYVSTVVGSSGEVDALTGFSGMQAFGLAFLSINSLTALYRSRDDPRNAAFILASYLDLLALFLCLRLFDSTHPDSLKRRGALKLAVWTLSTTLIAMFSYRVAAIMPFPVAILVWCMSGLTISGGFYAFFVHRSQDDDSCGAPLKPCKVCDSSARGTLIRARGMDMSAKLSCSTNVWPATWAWT
ncbi:hypothetical protein MUK42_12118 [Musa troglodytarum]|uniref:Uncharacterized protein n=1 Tax=Musa troglodytarum TaxID=320322 RepID=A0A9E7GN32_9LILI|nr:hypothetical protein MUK42_12118 [Musa troglodytarum]